MRTFALLALLFFPDTADWPDALVHVEGGQIKGTSSSSGQLRVFKGIPYAEAPVGRLRWKEPQPVIKWAGARRADAFGPRCMQARMSGMMVFRDSGTSEDCLYLNVWTPAKSAEEKLPVMLWIHGGLFQAGASSEAAHDGEALAAKEVVVVSINYRLGIFGFFAHPELRKESPHGSTGNYGLMDQVAALRWVSRNIKAFGGDPRRVTIFGESAGSMSVSALMASPLARELIAGAIGQSGAFFGPTFPLKPIREGEEQGERFAKSQSADLASLRALPAEQLLRASLSVQFSPIMDGYFLPQTPADVFAAGNQSQVPLLAGWNSDEMPWPVLLAKKKTTAESLKGLIRSKFGAEAAAVEQAYDATSDAEAEQAARDLSGDEFTGYSTWKWIELHARTKRTPVYRYLFTRVRPTKPGAKMGPTKLSDLGAFHGSEIEYVFGTFGAGDIFRWEPADYQLSELIQSYWTNFAKSGNPNGTGLPQWGAYGKVMHLDANAQARRDSRRARYEALDRFYSGQSSAR
jgi:para-nitrobenzyl esterase